MGGGGGGGGLLCKLGGPYIETSSMPVSWGMKCFQKITYIAVHTSVAHLLHDRLYTVPCYVYGLKLTYYFHWNHPQ